MKVLHILDHSIPLHSGYTFRTAAILREQRKLGWETHHLTSPKQGATTATFEDVDEFRFHRTPVPGASLPLLREIAQMRAIEVRLEALVRELRPDILHVHSPVLNAVPALRVGRRLGVPVVYEVRAFWEDAAVDHGTTAEGSLRYRATRALETWALKRADHVTCICEGLRQDIVARGIPSSKVTVIPNAVDVDNFTFCSPAEADLRQSLGLDGHRVLGFVGSFYAYEGLDLFLDAAAALRRDHPDIKVLLVGGGPQEKALRAQARALGIEDAVVFTGRVPNREVQRYYNLIDLLVYARHPMRLTELVTPLKPLEAMAQGKLFVASDVGGHRELIRNDETGYLFRAGDAADLGRTMARVLDQPEKWDAIRAAGRRFVESERNWRTSVARYRGVFSTLAPAAA
ncbi:TIGR04063 family PEP-CTERM/XrtA system glycosyltransferase [Methyloversatilis sp.]|uniref:TIGR04063 family PEP-CTERM/XrtA system glycosyltransferase n=2 Tax=Betaproteobacteria TaxID=28216 RepID=UPI0027BADA76|nr:TIGR04063 family PEP-CTERM/XrtA system glycosyltransferase [Methyloversatilis sp.]